MRPWLIFSLMLVSLAPVAAVAASGHGEAPNPVAEVLVEGFGVIVVAAVFVYTVLCFIRPGEHDGGHIKHRILGDEW